MDNVKKTVSTWFPAVVRAASMLLAAKLSGSALFGRFLSWVPAGGTLGTKAWIVVGVLGVSLLCLVALASWANKYYDYGYKGLAVYKALFRGLPSGKAYGVYIALSALTGGCWGALGASVMALVSHL